MGCDRTSTSRSISFARSSETKCSAVCLECPMVKRLVIGDLRLPGRSPGCSSRWSVPPRRETLCYIRGMSEPVSPLALEQINIVVRDMTRSLAFYRLLGVSIDEVPAEWAEWARHHVNGVASNGVRVEFDSVAFAKQWNPGLDEAKLGSAVIPIFHVSSRGEVDQVHARVTAAGHRSHKSPEDAFWGARYAIVEDPDGNSVGIMSPIDDSMRRPAPAPPH